jgi:hypothetical protein
MKPAVREILCKPTWFGAKFENFHLFKRESDQTKSGLRIELDERIPLTKKSSP